MLWRRSGYSRVLDEVIPFIYTYPCAYIPQSIYQMFYKEKSTADKGSLYQLRNILNRRNVSGPKQVITNFR
jgi:hypothetical protein